MPASRQLLQSITLNSTAASVTFLNISQIYTDLKIIVSARSDRSAVEDSLKFRFNGDSGSNYTSRLLYGNGSVAVSQTETSATYGTHYAIFSAATATANTFGTAEITVPSYTGAATKTISIFGASESNTGAGPSVGMSANLWNSTAAINSVTLFPYYGSWVTGSTFYLYGITQVPVIMGGTEYIEDGYKYHRFTATSSLRVIEAGKVECLLVGGGGGGGGHATNDTGGAGGGGGGVVSGLFDAAAGTHTVTVGGAGAAGTGATGSATQGGDGSASSVFSITAVGGGGGGAGSPGNGSGAPWAGRAGGCGGGAMKSGTAGAGTSGQGFNGGTSVDSGPAYGGGGGGGSGAVGANGTSSAPGNGGAARNVWGVPYGGGGAGGTVSGSPAYPLAGGGGAGGGAGSGGQSPAAGGANTGGGGGGARGGLSLAAETGAVGGSGIVIIRYPYISN